MGEVDDADLARQVGTFRRDAAEHCGDWNGTLGRMVLERLIASRGHVARDARAMAARGNRVFGIAIFARSEEGRVTSAVSVASERLLGGAQERAGGMGLITHNILGRICVREPRDQGASAKVVEIALVCALQHTTEVGEKLRVMMSPARIPVLVIVADLMGGEEYTAVLPGYLMAPPMDGRVLH